MSSSNYKFALNVQEEQSQVSIPVRLGDTDKELFISISDGGKPLTIEKGSIAVFVGKKADGTTITTSCIIEGNSVVRYDFTNQTTSYPGVVDCEIRLYNKDGKPIASPRFIMVVDERVIVDDDITSDNWITTLDELYGSEAQRRDAESKRVAAEWNRVASEKGRADAETSRVTAENERAEAETLRQSDFEYAETSRQETYETNESSRQSNFDYAESSRQSNFESFESSRQSNFESFESSRQSAYESNEEERWSAYRSHESSRESRFESEESSRQSTFESNEHSREEYFMQKEEERQSTFDANEEARENNFANAIKARASGEVIRVEDVSPHKHTVKCKVKSKNLYNTNSDYKNGEYTYTDGTLTISDRYTHKFIELEEGKTYTFSCKSTRTGADGGGVHIRAYKADQRTYVDIQGGSIINILSPTFTLTMPEGYPVLRLAFYGHATADGTGTSTYTELMLEEGSEATGYVPYVAPETVTVSRCGKNIIPYPYSRETFNGASVQFVINADRSVTITGTPTSDTQFDLATELLLPVGTYRLAGNGTNVRARISGADGSTRYSVNTFTVSAGDKVRIYLVALANEEIDYTYFPMLSLGEEELGYEEYIGTTYKPLSDGTVEGVKSVAPTMTLFTDTEGVEIEIEYNQDINVLLDYIKASLKAIIEIQNSLIGGEA